MKSRIYIETTIGFRATNDLHAGRAHGRMSMWNDPIVEEVRRVRENHAAKFNYDIGRIVSDVKERERKSGREVIPAPTRRLDRVGRERDQTP